MEQVRKSLAGAEHAVNEKRFDRRELVKEREKVAGNTIPERTLSNLNIHILILCYAFIHMIFFLNLRYISIQFVTYPSGTVHDDSPVRVL